MARLASGIAIVAGVFNVNSTEASTEIGAPCAGTDNDCFMRR